MSSSLVKLIDASLLPAAFLIVGKFLGLYLTIQFFDLEWQINFINNAFFGVYPVVFEADLPTVSSYSDLFMVFVMAAGYTFYVIRAVFFHSTHIDPRLVANMVRFNLLGLIEDSYKIYHEATMWFVFNCIADVLLILNSTVGKTYLWVVVLAIVINIVLTVILLKDVENEIERSKSNLVF